MLNINNIEVYGNPKNFAKRIDVKAHKFGFLDANDYSDYGGTIIGSFQTSQITNGSNLTLQTTELKNAMQQAVNNISDNYFWYQIKLGLDTKGPDGQDNHYKIIVSNITLTVEFQYED